MFQSKMQLYELINLYSVVASQAYDGIKTPPGMVSSEHRTTSLDVAVQRNIV
jgi:hypothetical protein